MSVFDTATNTVVNTVSIGGGSESFGNFVGFVGNNARAYVANGGVASVSVFQVPTIGGNLVSLSTAGTGNSLGTGNINVSTSAGLTIAANTTGSVNIGQLGTVGLAASS